jgi:Bacterial Ig-like domain (group 3).
LTVTATYSASTTATVTDYTLSGTLTEGTSTITVSYGGKTTTFSVTVTEDDRYSVEYQGNFTTASPSNTRVTLITNDVTLSEGETVTFSVPSGYKIFALHSFATGGDSAIDRTAKAVNQIYVNCVSSSGYTVPKDTTVCTDSSWFGIISFNKTIGPLK